MRRLFALAASAVVVASLALAGCGQAQPAPTPTRVPVAPTRAAEPTKAPAPAPTKATEPTKPPAQPTAAPAKKVEFPEKGKTINVIVPVSAGGTGDLAMRLLAPLMGKELGATVQVANKPGGGQQIGLTELVTSKPDGYSLGYIFLPTAITTYLDPERKAIFGRKDFQPVGNQYIAPVVISARGDGAYRSLKDVIDAAKANPRKVRAGTTGLLSNSHLAVLMLEKAADVKFASVHFEGGAPAMTALLGGHVDIAFNTLPNVVVPTKTGQVRTLGVMDKEESGFLPGVRTVESQGYKVYMSSTGGLAAPSGTPREVVDLLSGALKKAMATEDHRSKMEEMGQLVRFMDPAQLAAFWNEMEADIVPLMDLARAK